MVGVPEMTPVEALIVRPAGRPVADQVYGAVAPVAAKLSEVAAIRVPFWVPGLVIVGAVPVLKVNVAVPVTFAVSLAVTVTFAATVAVGVPAMTPVEALIVRPAGRPVADHVYGVFPPFAAIGTLVAVPVAAPCIPGLVTTTPVVQLNVALPVTFRVSFAVTVTLAVPAAVGVPETAPVEELIDNPAGRPVADQIYGAFPPCAVMARLAATPVGLTCVPGLATTIPVVHVNDALATTLTLSVAVTFIAKAPATVGVPVTAPVEVLIVRPVGRPVAVHVYGVVPPVADIANVAEIPVGLVWAPGFVTTNAVAAHAGNGIKNPASTAKVLSSTVAASRRGTAVPTRSRTTIPRPRLVMPYPPTTKTASETVGECPKSPRRKKGRTGQPSSNRSGTRRRLIRPTARHGPPRTASPGPPATEVPRARCTRLWRCPAR